MAVGPGKYDPQLRAALASVGATQGVLIVFDGALGPGISAKSEPGSVKVIATVMRTAADQLERDLRDLTVAAALDTWYQRR